MTVRGTGNEIYSVWNTNGTWSSGSTDRHGQTIGDPTTATDRYNRTDLFVPGTNNYPYYCVDSSGCTGWTQLSTASIASGSDITPLTTEPYNSDDEFYATPGLWHTWNLGGGESLGGTAVGTPAAITGQNNMDVFVRGTDGVIYHKWYGSSWQPSQTGYESMGLSLTSIVY